MPKLLTNFVLIVGLLCAFQTHAKDYPSATDYQKRTTAPAGQSLLRENDALKVMSETAVAKPEESARNIFGVSLSQLSAERVIIFANEKAVRYNLSDARMAIGANFAYLPIRRGGLWGLASSIHYTYLEQRAKALTSLHWAVADLGLMYRYERDANSLVKPFAVVGAASNVFFQRGQSDYKTSEARGTGFFTLGAAFNLSRTFKLSSPLLWELTARYKRVIDPGTPRMDLNAGLISLGMELAL